MFCVVMSFTFLSRSSRRRALLKRHMSVHNGLKDYVCSLCAYASSHKSNLDRHIQRVHRNSKLALSLAAEAARRAAQPIKAVPTNGQAIGDMAHDVVDGNIEQRQQQHQLNGLTTTHAVSNFCNVASALPMFIKQEVREHTYSFRPIPTPDHDYQSDAIDAAIILTQVLLSSCPLHADPYRVYVSSIV